MQSIIKNSKLVPEYLTYKLTAKSSGGYGIHSPFVYDFTREVVRQRRNFKIPKKLVTAHKDFLLSQKELNIGNWGAGSKSMDNSTTIGQIVKNSSVSPKLGGLLYRICQWANPQYILEIGTSVGVSTMYLASSNPGARIITLEGDVERIAIAKENLSELGIQNVEFLEGDIDITLSQVISSTPRLDVVFFDGNHRTEPTLRYFKQCSQLCHENTVFIFDDIRWSKEMFNTWKIICGHRSVSLSIDLFNVGIVFFRKGVVKQHFRINF